MNQMYQRILIILYYEYNQLKIFEFKNLVFSWKFNLKKMKLKLDQKGFAILRKIVLKTSSLKIV